MFSFMNASAQTIVMPSGSSSSSSTVTCGTTYDFYDDGDSFGDYDSGQNSELTVCPSDGTKKVTVSFNFVNVENCCDDLAVYNGTGTGTVLDADVDAAATFLSTAADGCLTFTFESDGTVQLPGWEATLSCAEDICISPNSPADYCDNASAIDLSQPFSGSTNCSYTESDAGGDGLDATGDQDPTCGGISLDNTSWLSFTAASTDVTLDWDITGGTSCTGAAGSTGIQLGVFEGNCGSLTFVGGSGNCLNPSGGIGSSGQFSMTGLTVGNEYYLMIDGFAGDLCDYNIEPVDGVAVLPPNDDCANATTLTCGAAAITGDNVLATNTDAPNGCPSAGSEQDGVWFTFTGDGNDYTINTTGSDFETDLNVYTASGTPANYCSNLTCEAAYTGAAQEATLTIPTTNGTVYYVYLDGKSGAEGSFSIAMTCTSAPACDAEAGSWN